MFKRFYKKAQVDAYVVRDSRTHKVIATGTKEKCLAYVSGFGLCYAEPA